MNAHAYVCVCSLEMTDEHQSFDLAARSVQLDEQTRKQWSMDYRRISNGTRDGCVYVRERVSFDPIVRSCDCCAATHNFFANE